MSIGRPLTKDDINQTAANLAGQLFSVTDNVLKFQAALARFGAPDLVAEFGFDTADANELISAIADMAEVAAALQGTADLTQRDRRFFARKLLATGVY